MASITKAQAKAIAAGLVSDLGIERNAAKLPVVGEVLTRGAKGFIDEAVKNLEGSTSSGTLASELTFGIAQEGAIFYLSIGYPKDSAAASYWDFVNSGVKGVISGDGKYKFKTIYPNKKMATALLLWYRKGASKVNVSDVKRYGEEGKTETKGTRLKKAISEADKLKALAYGTAVNIKKKGIKATHYFDEAARRTLGEDFKEAVITALAADVIITVKQFNEQ